MQVEKRREKKERLVALNCCQAFLHPEHDQIFFLITDWSYRVVGLVADVGYLLTSALWQSELTKCDRILI